MVKEGIASAIDFTKTLISLASAAIAFVIQPEFYGRDLTLKCLSTASIILLSACVLSGLLVFSAGSVMLANKNYDLENSYLKLPGIINVLSFGFGFSLLAAAVAIKIWR